MKKVLSFALAVIMVFGSVPLAAFSNFNLNGLFPLSAITAEAATAVVITTCDANPGDNNVWLDIDSDRVEWTCSASAKSYRYTVVEVDKSGQKIASPLVELKLTTSKYFRLSSINGMNPSSIYKVWVGCYTDSSGNTILQGDGGCEAYFRTNSTTPTVTTGKASNIGDTYATLSGTLEKNGGASIVDHGFVVSTSSSKLTLAKGDVYSLGSAGANKGTFTKKITDLSRAKTYYFKYYAQNENGVEYGDSASFTTNCSHSETDEKISTSNEVIYKSISSTQHQLKCYYDKYCTLCYQTVEKAYRYDTTTESHSFNSAGICEDCKYAKGCAHENQIKEYYDERYNITDSKTHEYVKYYKLVCDDCGIDVDTKVMWDTTTQNHSFLRNECTKCGYVKNQALSVTLTADSAKANVNTNFGATAQATGGAGGYQYTHSVFNEKNEELRYLSYSEITRFSYNTQKPGKYYFKVTVKDADGTTATATSDMITVVCPHETYDIDKFNITSTLEYEQYSDSQHYSVWYYNHDCKVCGYRYKEHVTDDENKSLENHSYSSNSNVCKCCGYTNNTTYTVTYNANGGTGAPASQTKQYNVTLKLSTVIPSKKGYTFLGWSTSATATSATYSAGGNYTKDQNCVLYAVWKTKAPSFEQYLAEQRITYETYILTQKMPHDLLSEAGRNQGFDKLVGLQCIIDGEEYYFSPEQYFEVILLDILYSRSRDKNYLNTLENNAMNLVSDIVGGLVEKGVAKSMSALSSKKLDSTLVNRIIDMYADYTVLDKESLFNLQEDASFFTENFETVGDLVDAIATYEQLISLKNKYIDILNSMYNHTDNILLKTAISNIKSGINNEFVKYRSEIFTEKTTEVGLNLACGLLEVVAKGSPVGVLIKAFKAGKTISGFLTGAKDITKTYVLIESLCEIEKTLSHTIVDMMSAYNSNKTQKNAANFNNAFDMLIFSKKYGIDLSVEFATIVYQENAMSYIKNAFGNGNKQKLSEFKSSCKTFTVYCDTFEVLSKSSWNNYLLEYLPEFAKEYSVEVVPKYHIVNFVSDFGINTTVRVEDGNVLVTAPSVQNPVVGAYKFYGWYRDKDCTVKWVSHSITSNETVYAKWVPDYSFHKTPNGVVVYYKINHNAATYNLRTMSMPLGNTSSVEDIPEYIDNMPVVGINSDFFESLSEEQVIVTIPESVVNFDETVAQSIGENITINCYKDSAAHKMVTENDIAHNVIYQSETLAQNITIESVVDVLDVGKTLKLDVKFVPSVVDLPIIKWRSNNTDIAFVDSNGVVFGRSAGTVVIYGETVDGSDLVATYTLNIVDYNSFNIKEPSETIISYGDAIILHVGVNGTLPSDVTIKWESSNNNFDINVSADGTSCKISPNTKGDTTFTVTVYDETGNVIGTDTQIMTSKAGFFDKIIAFFKKLFGLSKTIPQNYKAVF